MTRRVHRSITTGCSTLSNSISKTSGAVRAFVREIRESRSELDAISGELYSLDGVLDLLKDDAASFPPTLAHRTPVLLDRCVAIVNELGGYISTINASGLSKHDKKFRWIATRKHMAKLGGTLEVHKATLGLALDMVSLYVLSYLLPASSCPNIWIVGAALATAEYSQGKTMLQMLLPTIATRPRASRELWLK